jgi:hypothetical protein
MCSHTQSEHLALSVDMHCYRPPIDHSAPLSDRDVRVTALNSQDIGGVYLVPEHENTTGLSEGSRTAYDSTRVSFDLSHFICSGSPPLN